MDNKAWLWRKKSTEKINAATDKVNLPSKNYEEEIQTLLADKEELENNLKSLDSKLSSALSECDAKDDLVKKHAKLAQEARLDCEKAEMKIASFKHELDEALQKSAAGEERCTYLDVALKECMQQLCFVRAEQEQRIHDAVMKTSMEFDKSKTNLEEQLAETNRRVAKVGAENTHLAKALLLKDKLIEDISKQKLLLEADINALMARFESTEKANASLKYEVRVLEKELDIRNEETEFTRTTADASHKQHLDSVKRIAKLESECQRLRVLVRKRLPGPAALAKMKSEVEMLGRDSVETRRRRSNNGSNGLTVESAATDSSPETPSRKINFLEEQLHILEEENKILKEALSKKANELQFSRAMFARTASKLSQVEPHVDELSKAQTTLESSRSNLPSHDLSLASMSDVGSDDKASCAESWASALISELEHFKHEKQRGSSSTKTFGAADLNLMDDFIEMEKFAIVSLDKHYGSPLISSDNDNAVVSPLETNSKGFPSGVTGREIILAAEAGSEVQKQEIDGNDKASNGLHDILKAVLEISHASERSIDDILEDVRVSLASTSLGGTAENIDAKNSIKLNDTINASHIGGYIGRKPTEEDSGVNALLGHNNNYQMQSDLSKAMGKIIEILEGISLPYPDYSTCVNLPQKDGSFLSHKTMETHSGYVVRVFQWKVSELSAVLQQFVHSCYDLQNGKSDVNKFSQELWSGLDWIINHCFSIQDVSSMRDAVKKHFDWDETRSEGEEVGMTGHLSGSGMPIMTTSNGRHHKPLEKDATQSTTGGDNKSPEDELISKITAKELEGKLKSATDESEMLINQLQESEKTIKMLQTEVETLKGSSMMPENHKLLKEDLDAQLEVARVELNEVRQHFSSLETELENKVNDCEELEATCLELQLQLESATKMAIPDNENHQQEKQLRADWEITAASEKLAECQETIMNLGKQLKALASPKDAAMFDKVISTPAEMNETVVTTATSTVMSAPKNKLRNQRSSLLDRMLADDNAKEKDPHKFPETSAETENSCPSCRCKGAIEPLEKILILNGSKRQDNDVTIKSLAIVPRRKQGGLWRKLLWGRKRSSGKKPPISFAS